MKNFMREIYYRLRHGYWCIHEWGPWYIVDLGFVMARRCRRCGCVQRNC